MTIPSNLIPTRISDLPVAPVPTGTGTVVVVIGGVTYQAVFNDLLTSVEVPASRTITAGTGLTGGGDLSQNRTIAVAAGGIGDTQLDTTGVVAGTYGSTTEIPQFVVNAQGRITGVTLVTPSFAGLVPDSRQIIAGAGLTGGGNLSANRTLAIDFSNATPEPLGSASAGVGTIAARDDHVHPAVDLEDSSQVTGRLGIANGGTGQNITNLTAGAVLYSDGTNLVLQTPSGSNGQVLTSTGGGAPTWATVTGVGTVTSVGLSLPSIFNVTGSPVTAAGTLTGDLATQVANTIFAGPSTGVDDVPAFRTLVNADLQYSSTTLGSTTLTLGGTVTTLAGIDTITVTGNPTNALELAPKQYVDSVAQGLDVKASCKYASTANVASISGVVTIDGQSTSTGDRILLKNQNTASENGIYVADDAGAWARSADMDNWSEVPGAFVFIESGDTQADTGWVCTADQGGTIGVTNMPWSQFSGVGTYIAGTGLTLTGNTFSITNTAVVAASYGAADKTLTATVNAQGQLTALADTAIAITNSQVSGSAASGTNSDITSMSGLTGGISTPDYIDFDAALGALPSSTTGRLYYNNDDNAKTLQLIGENSIEIKLGEENYYRVKASAAINKGDVVMFTGTVGASGGLEGAPATGLTAATGSYIIGVAEENISLNGWGYVISMGEVRGINTSGSTASETWNDGDILYYNPAVTGGLTKTVPNAPNAKVQVAAVVYADASNGIIYVRPTFEPRFNDLSDVYTPSPSDGDLVAWSNSNSRWENAAQSTITAGLATSLTNGTAGDLPYQTASNTTAFLTLGTSGQVLTAGASAPQYTNQSSLSVGTATNLAGGTGGEVAYQSGAGATGFTAVGTTGQFLISGGTGAPTWTDTISGGTYS